VSSVFVGLTQTILLCYGLRMEKTAQKLISGWLEAEGRKASWLARQVPVNRTTLWVWMTGANVPTLPHRKRLQEVTGLPVADEGAWL
jgi:hypothetical protein